MKSQNLLIATAVLALVAGCSKNNPPPPPPQPQVPMVQMCGIDPEDGDQECILVPQNQMAAANQQGFYQYQNGEYRDNSGNLMAAAAVGAAAAYLMSQNRDRYYADRQQYRQRYHYSQPYNGANNQRQQYRDNNGNAYGHDKQRYASQPAMQTTGVPNKPFVPQAAKVATTTKAPTGGLMAGHTEINLKDTRGVPAPAAAPNFAPATKPTVPAFQPTAASAPRPAPTQFTPQSARQTFTPPAAQQTFKPQSASTFKPAPAPAFKPQSASTFKPAPARQSTFKPSSAKSSSSSKRK